MLHRNLPVLRHLLKRPCSVERHHMHLRQLPHHPRTVTPLHQARSHRHHQDQWVECLRHETLHRHQGNSPRLRHHTHRRRSSKCLQPQLLHRQRDPHKDPHELDLLWEALLRADHQDKILDLELDNPMEQLQQQPSIVSGFF